MSLTVPGDTDGLSVADESQQPVGQRGAEAAKQNPAGPVFCAIEIWSFGLLQGSQRMLNVSPFHWSGLRHFEKPELEIKNKLGQHIEGRRSPGLGGRGEAGTGRKGTEPWKLPGSPGRQLLWVGSFLAAHSVSERL